MGFYGTSNIEVSTSLIVYLCYHCVIIIIIMLYEHVQILNHSTFSF